MKRYIKSGLYVLAVIAAVLIICVPLYLLFKYSISDVGSINTGGEPIPLWPQQPTFSSFLYIFSDPAIYTVIGNSVFIASMTVLLSMSLGVPASYVLSRYSFPFKKALLIGLISIRLFPDIASVVPITEFFITINAQNTYWGVILAHTLLALPYVIFIGNSAFEPIPHELEEQAIVMGSGKIRVFFTILLPIAIPGLMAAAIYTLILSWHEFVFAYFLLGLGKISTLTLYLKQNLAYSPPQNILAAISVCLTLPVLLFTLLFQRYMVKDVAYGSIR